METYDYIVIGAGSAGSIVASKLAAYDSEIRILLIEAGGIPNNPEMWTPSDWFKVLKNCPAIEWGYQSVPQPNLNNRCIELAQAKVLGGCALHNAMVYVRGSSSDFDAWGEVASGWSWNNVLPHFEEVEQTMKVTIGEADDFINDLFTAAKEYGLPYNPNYNTNESQYGYAKFQFNVINSLNLFNAPSLTRQTTYSAFRLDRCENVTVLSGAFVTRIRFKDSVAVGVEYIKDGQTIVADVHKEVILSAGAIASPKILMLSGVGNENELNKFKIPVIANVPEVGKNFHDDLFVSVGFSIPSTREVPFYTYGVAPAVIFGSTKNSSSVIDVETSVGVGTLKGFSEDLKNSFWLWPNIMHLESKGTVTLCSSNPNDAPLVDPGYLTAPGDLEKCKMALELGIDIANKPGLDAWRCEQIDPPGQDLETYIRKNADTTHHYCGTCRMGDDEDSVVDTELKVRHTSGLRVIDSSVFPLPITANTAAATMMIADKGTDIIINSL